MIFLMMIGYLYGQFLCLKGFGSLLQVLKLPLKRAMLSKGMRLEFNITNRLLWTGS